MDGVDYAGICELARATVLDKIKDLAQDRMGQGEHLTAEGYLSWLGDGDDTHDNEVFGTYESYLNYIHYIVANTPIPLHVQEPSN